MEPALLANSPQSDRQILQKNPFFRAPGKSRPVRQKPLESRSFYLPKNATLQVVFSIRSDQMSALAVLGEVRTESRALRHLRNCIPEVCAALSESELREIVLWGRRRSRRYGIEREFDFFRYLNLMFMFGFEFDTSPRYPWASRALNAKGQPGARVDLLMDHAMLFCSQAAAKEAQ